MITFVGSIFVLYRVLVSQKDATIELLREKIDLQKEKSTAANADELASALGGRVELLTDELSRLRCDKETNSELIRKKEAELSDIADMYQRIQSMVMHTSGMSVSYFCPVCEEPTISEAESKLRFHNKQPDYFLVKYHCGYSEIDGKKTSDCKGGNDL